ncbi:MAG: ABC transporter ATP-binding protein, partial [Planctomycetota bacterium]
VPLPQNNKNNTILSWEKISKSYGEIEALKDFSGSMQKGITGLLGPNGAGKTTFLKILISLLQADSGEIFLGGNKINSKNPFHLTQIGYMPEYTAHIPGHTPVTYLTFLCELQGMSRKEALFRSHEVLFYIGMGEERYRNMEELSYGQLQRVMLCQALAHDPEILLLDEPTTGLDPEGRKEFLALMKELASEYDKTILFSSHILEDVEEICENILLLHKGQLLFSGPINEFQKGKENLYAFQFWEENPAFLDFLQSAEISYTQNERGEWIVQLDSHEKLENLLEGVRKTNTILKSLTPYQRPLEEVFMEFLKSPA